MTLKIRALLTYPVECKTPASFYRPSIFLGLGLLFMAALFVNPANLPQAAASANLAGPPKAVNAAYLLAPFEADLSV